MPHRTLLSQCWARSGSRSSNGRGVAEARLTTRCSGLASLAAELGIVRPQSCSGALLSGFSAPYLPSRGTGGRLTHIGTVLIFMPSQMSSWKPLEMRRDLCNTSLPPAVKRTATSCACGSLRASRSGVRLLPRWAAESDVAVRLQTLVITSLMLGVARRVRNNKRSRARVARFALYLH